MARRGDDGIELHWPGKHDRPADLDETPRMRRVAQVGAPAVPGQPPSRLFHGDNGPVMHALMPELAGRVDLIYADPPFTTGKRHALATRPGADPPTVSEPAFDDRWPDGLAGYLSFMLARLQLFHRLLAPNGTLLLHCDPRTDWALRCLLDEVFGPGRIINQIIWHYTGGGRSRRYFSRKHDVLWWVAKGERWTFNIDAVRRPYRPTSGYARAGITARSGKRYLPHPAGTPVDDVWHIPILNPLAGERLGYPTQKPERLLERIVLAASNPGDLVADFFCGSGTTLAVAQRLGRRWLGCDASAAAVATTRRRLAALPEPAAYESWAVVAGPTTTDQTACNPGFPPG